MIFFLLFLSFSTSGVTCQLIADSLAVFNEQLHFYQHLEAQNAWNSSLGINSSVGALGELAISKHVWTSNWCQRLLRAVYQQPISQREARQIYLFCRGPQFSAAQLSQVIALLSKMQEIYSTQKVFSMKMEPDLNNFMERTRDEPALRTAWTEWFRGTGTKVKPMYEQLVPLLNIGARNAGRQDMGEIWREEMEIPNLSEFALELYSQVKDLYALLHSVVRHKLASFYQIKLGTTIPAHLLGNMWAQKWDSLLDIIFPDNRNQQANNADALVKEMVSAGKVNATPLDAVNAAEGFFISMGFPRVPQKLYTNSYFTEDEKFPWKNCHGTAANMHDSEAGDYRMMMCIPKENMTDEDLLTLTHEMGHIYYFMAYSRLEPIFQDGANSAFHESVGDSVTYGLKSRRKSSADEEVKQLFKVALAKLPQIGFGLIMDLWRWYVFENESSPETWNAYWWQLNYDFLGISPPKGYLTEGLDAAGKYHVTENVPYIRYFLASYLQLQFFEAFCEDYENIHECQLQGNKKAGRKLWKMMEKGSSEHWSVVLKEMTGSSEILSKPLLRYFEPIRIWLEAEVLRNNLTVGW